MPNLINTDSAGNVFYNYITPVVKGELIQPSSTMYDSFFTEKLGAAGTNWNNYVGWYNLRFPAPGLEMKTGAVDTTNTGGDHRVSFYYEITRQIINSNNTDSATGNWIGNTFGGTDLYLNATPRYTFQVINDYALCTAIFTNATLTSLKNFTYLGWLREPVFTGTSTGVLGLVRLCIVNNTTVEFAIRPVAANSTSSTTLSTAADTITSPPIVCTTGTDPGDGSETFTDIVIRDAASPNNPVGKLWNCIDMPASCNVGELWRNTGAYDGDASASEQDIYLCVMPWGTRKLGMRVWTENVT